MDSSDYEVFIVGEGVSGINQLLAQGWRIIGSVTFARIERGRVGTPDRTLQYIPYAPMGRKIQAGEMVDAVRAEAVAFSNAQQQTSAFREEDLLSDVPPLVDEDEPIGESRTEAYRPEDGSRSQARQSEEPAPPPIRRRKPQTIAETAAASVRE